MNTSSIRNTSRMSMPNVVVCLKTLLAQSSVFPYVRLPGPAMLTDCDAHTHRKSEVSNMLESAGFSKSNPYYVVQQGKVSR